jgi:hypothetical protein
MLEAKKKGAEITRVGLNAEEFAERRNLALLEEAMRRLRRWHTAKTR